jgi:short subunit dehydrogenase-like uncharacterized protein
VLDVVVFGATGYTGALVSHALARRGARFAVAGRNRARLEAVARDTGADAAHVAAVGDVDALAGALGNARVLLTCVGPFHALGDTAVRAALAAGVHYVDAAGEASFVAWLRSEHDAAARAAGVTLAPCFAFGEVPADVAATLATRGMHGADLTLTYALPSSASAGTVRAALDILTAPARGCATASRSRSPRGRSNAGHRCHRRWECARASLPTWRRPSSRRYI